MFKNILCANDGSERASHAVALAVTLARDNKSELHMVCVEEVDYMPLMVEEVREETGTAARRFHKAIQSARAMADNNGVKLNVHVLAGHPVRDIIRIATELKTDLLVIGSAGHSQFYGRMLGSRADRLVHLAPCPVLVVR